MRLRKLKDKRGLGINDLYPIILTIAAVAILIGIVMMVLTEWQEVTSNKEITTFNETLTNPNVTEVGASVGNATVCGFSNFAVIIARNASGVSEGCIIDAANYTVDADTGTIFASTDITAEYNNTAWNITYSFNYGGESCQATLDVIDDLTDFIPWIGIILLVIAAAIVLGIVISSFRKPRI